MSTILPLNHHPSPMRYVCLNHRQGVATSLNLIEEIVLQRLLVSLNFLVNDRS